MAPPPWQKYVGTLCAEAWDFDATATASVLDQLEALIHDEQVTDGTVVNVLVAAGVAETSAMLIAPSIRVSIAA
jgi:hypothetical protein